MSITHQRFASQAAYLASRSASWAGDSLSLPEDAHELMRGDSVERYLKMLRETADHIEMMHASEERFR